jgi:dihydroorotate dehydrogenase electron transfer subunit
MTDEQQIQPDAKKPVPPVPSEVEGSEPAGSKVEPPAVTKVEPPEVSKAEPPVVSAAEPPVVSAAEPPVVSAAEPPVVSAAEPPVVSAAEPPVVSAAEPQKGRFEAKVSFQKKLNERFYRLGLHLEGRGAEAFEKMTPGQFAQFDVSNLSTPAPAAIPEELRDASNRQLLLRRPFSFARVVKEKNITTVEVLYQVLGPGTIRMTTLAKGDVISIIGPLGNGFRVPQGKKLAILVAGGMGFPPLEHLAQFITTHHKEIEPIAFVGAKTRYNLPFEKQLDKLSQELEFSIGEFGRYVVRSLVATDDGSAGFKGTVTDCMLDWLGKNNLNPAQAIIYACGPPAMLARIAAVAAEKHIDCQVSMEEMMACGIGLCQSCVIKCKSDTPGQTTYKLCCKDGPVFDSKDIAF